MTPPTPEPAAMRVPFGMAAVPEDTPPPRVPGTRSAAAPVAAGRPVSRSGRVERVPGTGIHLPAGENGPVVAGEDRPGRGDPVNTPPRPGRDAWEPRSWTIELPPGLPLLSLNGREHWAERHRKTQAFKKAAWAMAVKAKIPPLERVSIVAEYQPGDLRKRDADNPIPSVKACIDGIVAAGCLPGDDSPRYVASVTGTIGSLYPKGRLVLTITEAPPMPVLVKRARTPRSLPPAGGAA